MYSYHFAALISNGRHSSVTTSSPTPEAFSFRNGVDFDSQASIGARSGQEDYAFLSVAPSGSELLAVLADGMGGHSAGEVASKRAVDTFHSTFSSYPSGSVPAKLGAALNQANSDLAVCVKNSPALSGMGCTLVGAHISDRGLQWISVGDSPLFLFRNGKIKRLNADHSMAPVIEESRRQGKITDAEALSHPDRHALRSAVSGSDLAMIDSSNSPQALRKGDVIVLASDGLLTLSEAEIAKIIKGLVGEKAQVLVNALMKSVSAKKKPRQDNTTVQVVIAPRSMGVSTTLPTAMWWLLASALTVAAIGLFHFSNDIPLKLPNFSGLMTKPEAPPAPIPVPVPVDEPQKPAAPPGAETPPAVPPPTPATVVPPVPGAPGGKPGVKQKLVVSAKPSKAGAPNSSETVPTPTIPTPPIPPAAIASEQSVQVAPVASPNPVGPTKALVEKDAPAKQQPLPNNTLPTSATPASSASAPVVTPPGNETNNK